MGRFALGFPEAGSVPFVQDWDLTMFKVVPMVIFKNTTGVSEMLW